MDDLQSILARVLHKRGLRVHADAARTTHIAMQELRRLVPECAAYCSIKSFSGGTLLIEVQNSIAAQECQLKISALQEAIFAGTQIEVKEVRIVRQTVRR